LTVDSSITSERPQQPIDGRFEPIRDLSEAVDVEGLQARKVEIDAAAAACLTKLWISP
jgi:hypothetical protein